MSAKYSAEKNVQLLLDILKHHNIKRVVVSPGAQNICFVGSIQSDPFFEIYSAPDERSAAYIACGMAAETCKPVVISCTGATASRNYLPGLTEAYYRKLPVLAVTSTRHQAWVGQNIPQIIDRSILPKDTAKKSVHVTSINCADDEWGAIVSINDAVLSLTHEGGGPAHINLETTGSTDFSVSELRKARYIDRVTVGDIFPQIEEKKTVAIFVGAHLRWDNNLKEEVELFCEHYNAVVLCDHTSNYFGKYKIMPSLITYQSQYKAECTKIDLLIDIGDVSGAYITLSPKEVWRVNPDGGIRDSFRKLRYVFQMTEICFFKYYNSLNQNTGNTQYYDTWKKEYDELYALMPKVPFSNIWVAGQMINKINDSNVVHLAILNSLRSWNFYESKSNVTFYANTGGFGIDGPISTVLGGALANPGAIHYLIVGDLAFFYDMNALGNRHFASNIRILLINNGIGTEFKNYSHRAAAFGDEANAYIAAGGHYGNKSNVLVKHYAQDLGFKYLSSKTKEEFYNNIDMFTNAEIERPIIFEVFTEHHDESNALRLVRNLRSSLGKSTKAVVKNVLGKQNIRRFKNLIK